MVHISDTISSSPQPTVLCMYRRPQSQSQRAAQPEVCVKGGSLKGVAGSVWAISCRTRGWIQDHSGRQAFSVSGVDREDESFSTQIYVALSSCPPPQGKLTTPILEATTWCILFHGLCRPNVTCSAREETADIYHLKWCKNRHFNNLAKATLVLRLQVRLMCFLGIMCGRQLP